MSSAYAYTLQTVPYEISVEEQRAAQMLMWRSSNKVAPKIWIILGVVAALAVLGLIFLKNYSTIFCWVILIGIALFLFVRLVAYEWYVKRKMNEMPVQEISGIKLGIQPQGMVMQQKMGIQQGVANIAWKDVSEWYDSKEFLLMTFTIKGQQGSFFLPSRMDGKAFPFNTIRKHLNESVGTAKTF